MGPYMWGSESNQAYKREDYLEENPLKIWGILALTDKINHTPKTSLTRCIEGIVCIYVLVMDCSYANISIRCSGGKGDLRKTVETFLSTLSQLQGVY